MKLSITLCILLYAFSVYAAPPVFDTVGSQGLATGLNVASISPTITIDAGCTNNVVVVDAFMLSGTPTISGITVDGNAASEIITQQNTATGDNSTGLWLRKGVTTGARTVVVTPTDSADAALTASARAYCSVNQSTPYGTPASSQDSGGDLHPTLTVTSATGELVIDAVRTGVDGTTTDTISVGAGQTQRTNDTAWNITPPNLYFMVGESDEPGAASVVMDWTISGVVVENWEMVGVSLKPLAGAAAPARRRAVIVQ